MFSSGNRVSRSLIGIHDPVQEGRRQCDPCGNGEVQFPYQRQRDDEHDRSGSDIWDRHVSSKSDFVDARSPLDGFVPFVGHGRTLEDGDERVGGAGGEDDKADQTDGDGERSVPCCEYTDVEQENRTFGQGYGEAVEDQPGHEALGTSSVNWANV